MENFFEIFAAFAEVSSGYDGIIGFKYPALHDYSGADIYL